MSEQLTLKHNIGKGVSKVRQCMSFKLISELLAGIESSIEAASSGSGKEAGRRGGGAEIEFISDKTAKIYINDIWKFQVQVSSHDVMDIYYRDASDPKALHLYGTGVGRINVAAATLAHTQSDTKVAEEGISTKGKRKVSQLLENTTALSLMPAEVIQASKRKKAAVAMGNAEAAALVNKAGAATAAAAAKKLLKASGKKEQKSRTAQAVFGVLLREVPMCATAADITSFLTGLSPMHMFCVFCAASCSALNNDFNLSASLQELALGRGNCSVYVEFSTKQAANSAITRSHELMSVRTIAAEASSSSSSSTVKKGKNGMKTKVPISVGAAALDEMAWIRGFGVRIHAHVEYIGPWLSGIMQEYDHFAAAHVHLGLVANSAGENRPGHDIGHDMVAGIYDKDPLLLHHHWANLGYSAPIHPDLIIFSALDGRNSVAIDSLHQINQSHGKTSSSSSHVYYDDRDWNGVATRTSATNSGDSTFDWLQCNIHHLQRMRSVLILQTMFGSNTITITQKELPQISPLPMPVAAASAGFSVDILDLCTRKQIFLQHMYRFLAKSRPSW